MYFLVIQIFRFHFNLPMQDLKSEPRMYPGLHSHLFVPFWLTQVWAHPPLLMLHSSTSVYKKEKFTLIECLHLVLYYESL